jgi:hypothetical protein
VKLANRSKKNDNSDYNEGNFRIDQLQFPPLRCQTNIEITRINREERDPLAIRNGLEISPEVKETEVALLAQVEADSQETECLPQIEVANEVADKELYEGFNIALLNYFTSEVTINTPETSINIIRVRLIDLVEQSSPQVLQTRAHTLSGLDNELNYLNNLKKTIEKMLDHLIEIERQALKKANKNPNFGEEHHNFIKNTRELEH